MTRHWNISVVGPGTLVGETLLEVLEARAFPVGKVYLVDPQDSAGETYAALGAEYVSTPLETFDFAVCDIAFFCLTAAWAREYVPRAAQTGAVVIDDSDAFRMEADVPLVVPEVNAEALAAWPSRRIVASPNSCATFIASVLKPLHDAAGVRRVNAVTLQAVSGAGRAAVEELAQQSVDLFNQRALAPEVFAKQIAFNLLPRIGAVAEDGFTAEEHKIAAEVMKLLQAPDLGLNVTSVRVPVFYGHSVALHLETARALGAEAAAALLDRQPGLVVLDDRSPQGFPTPVMEAAANDPVFVGRIRKDPTHPQGLDLWAVSDNIRKGAALNMVQIAENLIEKYPA